MKQYLFILLACIAIAGTSCKNEFERIRANSDPEFIYEQAFKYYDKGEYLKAQTLFEQILSNYRGKAKAEKLYFSYAYSHYYLGTYVSSAFYFKNFAQTFSTSGFREEADFMTAISHYRLSPVYRLDQTYTLKAIEDFQTFVNLYPSSERVAECNKYIDELRAKLEVKAFAEGQLYFDLKQYQAAIQSLENMLRDFPESQNAQEVRYKILQASFFLAENSVYERQRERYEQVLEKFNNFRNKYPKSKLLKEADSYKKKAQLKIKELSNV